MGQRAVGAERQGLAVTQGRLVQPPLLIKHQAETGIGLGPSRPQGQRPPVMDLRLVQPALLLQEIAEIEVRLGIIGAHRQRPADQRFGGVIGSGLGGQHPQQVQTVRMIGVHSQNLPVKPFGLGQPAGLVMSERQREGRSHDRGSTQGSQRPPAVGGGMINRNLVSKQRAIGILRIVSIGKCSRCGPLPVS